MRQIDVPLYTIQVLVTISVYLDLKIHQVDIKMAFLNGKLKEEMYVKPP
jgi:hypothetical protein